MADTTFDIFESVSYTNRPYSIGLTRATILYDNMLWRSGEPKSGPPTPESIEYWTTMFKQIALTGPLILDIEHWPIYTDPTTRQYMVDIVNQFKMADRGYQVGYYGFVPQRDTFASLHPWHESFTLWQGRNTTVQPIAEAVDALYPSLYTLYADKQRWEDYAVKNIMEARRIAPGKRIVPMLWPQYHTNCDRKALQYIDQDFWYEQLALVYRMCDGAVIWRGGDEKIWNWGFPWLATTKAFLEKIRSVNGL